MKLPFLTRRNFLASSMLVMASTISADTVADLMADDTLSVEEAYDLAQSGVITLVDIRRPDEWQSTGVGVGAHPLDMRSKDFLAQLKVLVGGDKSKPVAVMCARGVRSKWLSRQLVAAGFTKILDVPEGMLGSKAGPGWVRIGLPVVQD